MIRKSASSVRLTKWVWNTASSRFFSLLSGACYSGILECRGEMGEVEGGHVGKPDADLKFLQSICNHQGGAEGARGESTGWGDGGVG